MLHVVCLGLFLHVGGISTSGEDHSLEGASLLQVARSSPNLNFFDDVPTPVLQQAAGKSTQAMLGGRAVAATDRLLVGPSPLAAASKQDSIPAASLQAQTSDMELNDLKPLEKFSKEEQKAEHEDLDDPRTSGFAVRSYRLGSSAPVAQRTPEGGHSPGRPGFWDTVSLAGAGVRAALSNAMPEWQGGAKIEDTRPSVPEIAEVDRSAVFTPSATGIMSQH